MKNYYSFSEIIRKATHDLMKKHKKVVCIGLGVEDPKSIFGTLKDLKRIFGTDRIIETPTSENAMTGLCIGLSLNKFRPIMIHQRNDFFLLAMDQLVNNAAKWNFMFGGKMKTPITIRLIVGRGWGQGPTHSQSLQSWFAHIPGLKVVAPTFPNDAKDLLNACVQEDTPCIFIEHRWLHDIKGIIKTKYQKNIIGKAKLISNGKDLTIISYSYSTIEVLKLTKILKKNNISIDHIDLRSIKPLDYMTILKSLKKTKKILIVDNMSHPICSIGDHILSYLHQTLRNRVNFISKILSLPDIPVPTSHYLTKYYYINSKVILKEISLLTSKNIKINSSNNKELTLDSHDIPNKNFNGPF
jgi:pyruvate/2-oxoglutarate/acetoin dehydrogenase E1 component